MNNDFELATKYDDISKTEKPKIPAYHGDMFIDIETEYLMRKDLQQRIDKAIEIYKNKNTCKYKKQRFMEDKTTADLMYEAIKGSEE